MADKKEKKVGGEDISNTEWGIVIGILLIMDIIQFGLNALFLSGIIINRFLDFIIGLAWTTYLKLRGVKLDAKKVANIGITFFLEMIPAVDVLPLWTLDGVIIFLTVKAEKELAKVAEAGVAVAAVALAPETGGASLAAGEAIEGGIAATEAAEAGGAVAEGVGAEEGSGISDEYADSMGAESDGGSDESDDSTDNSGLEAEGATGERGEGDEAPQTPDEVADAEGAESDRAAGERAGETPADRAKREEEEAKKKKDGSKKKPNDRGGGGGDSLFGGGQKDEDRGSGSNRGGSRGTAASQARDAEKRKRGALDNLLDLSGLGGRPEDN